jgi:hypothetical protein
MKSADAQRDNIEQLNEHNCPTETIRSWRDLEQPFEETLPGRAGKG